MTKPEILVKKHLEDTYLVVGKISKNELKNMNTVKGKSIDIQKDERENLLKKMVGKIGNLIILQKWMKSQFRVVLFLQG